VRVDRVFALLIESGFIYCCIWVCPTSTLAEGLTALLQIFYLISAFGVLPQPDFIIIVFISVSTVHMFLRHIFSSTKYRLDIEFISDAHNRPSWHANEPR
jgi:sterol desaturase/sphingolipid hydroxylase (fatty acid hydroxylase superfamily)